jgi:hypothetical protein
MTEKNFQKAVKKLKNWQSFTFLVKKMSKNCQKNVKELLKSCQKFIKNLPTIMSEFCQVKTGSGEEAEEKEDWCLLDPGARFTKVNSSVCSGLTVV